MTEPDQKKPVKAKSVTPASGTQPVQLISIQSDLAMQSTTNPKWIIGTIKSNIGEIPVIDTKLNFSDRIGGWKVRWSFGRNDYRVTPGLYAVGQPTENSPVFVSANYKLSFDRLRENLGGIDGWIMVIDTKGINVWCAAGKGTFGTDEIVARIGQTGLPKIVTHRRLIVPQLGAPGISAHEVKDRSGFRIVYGPIRAEDIPAYILAGNKVTPKMRQVRFSTWERAVLIPNDLIASFKYALIIAAFLFVISGFGPGIFSIERMIDKGSILATLMIASYVIGTAVPPILLPLLPGKSFSLKGVWVGLLAFLLLVWSSSGDSSLLPNQPTVYAWLLIFTAVSSFVTMNFTGNSTYTSLSGVLKEMKVAVPIQIGAASIGLILLIIGIFL